MEYPIEEKILIATITTRMVWGKTMQSFMDLAKYMGDRADFKVIVGCAIPPARNSLCDSTVRKRYKGLCMIDSDQTFPQDAVDLLVERDKDIIGYLIKDRERESVNAGNLIPDRKYRQVALREYPSESTFQVGWLGTGFIYIKRQTLEKIPYPWFSYANGKDERGHDYPVHSDFYFSLKADKHGLSVWACTERLVGHLAVKEVFACGTE